MLNTRYSYISPQLDKCFESLLSYVYHINYRPFVLNVCCVKGLIGLLNGMTFYTYIHFNTLIKEVWDSVKDIVQSMSGNIKFLSN